MADPPRLAASPLPPVALAHHHRLTWRTLLVTTPLVRVATEVRRDVETGRLLWLWCPGCEAPHCPRAPLPDGARPDPGPYWEWNGAADEAFTIAPSLLVHGAVRCHSFIRDGRWEFLADSEHALAGQTVPLVPLPDWLVGS